MDSTNNFAAFIVFFVVTGILIFIVPFLGRALFILLKLVIKQSWLAAGLAGMAIALLTGYVVAEGIGQLKDLDGLVAYAVPWYLAWVTNGFMAGVTLEGNFVSKDQPTK